eukprot:gene11722-35012_t
MRINTMRTAMRTSTSNRPALRVAPGPAAFRTIRPRVVLVRATSQVEDLLLKGKERYLAKDLPSALKVFEDVMNKTDISNEERLAAMYGAMSVHCSFGDVEVAQMALRGFADCQRFQIMIQLKNFNKKLRTNMATKPRKPKADRQQYVYDAPSKGEKAELDLASILGTPGEDGIDDGLAIDASPLDLLLSVPSYFCLFDRSWSYYQNSGGWTPEQQTAGSKYIAIRSIGEFGVYVYATQKPATMAFEMSRRQ